MATFADVQFNSAVKWVSGCIKWVDGSEKVPDYTDVMQGWSFSKKWQDGQLEEMTTKDKTFRLC